MTDSKEMIDGLAKLREPFAPNQIGKLPRAGIQLDFVGHAVITARLLDVDPLWSWEPLAFDAQGLPAFDEFGGLWIKLTVCGLTRLGYGDAEGKRGYNATKIAIGDALRNAGMRFGLALDLWTKGDLDAHPPQRAQRKSPADLARDELLKLCDKLKLEPTAIAARFADDYGLSIMEADAATINAFRLVIADENPDDAPA